MFCEVVFEENNIRRLSYFS